MTLKRITSTVMVAAAALTVFLTAQAQQGQWAADDDPTAQSIIDMERQWAEDACTHNGIVPTILADDFQGTAPNGERYTKPDEVKQEKTSTTEARDCRLHEARVRFFGDNIALVYGSESSTRKDAEGKDVTRTLVWTDTWLKRNGRWQIVAAQDTRVDHP